MFDFFHRLRNPHCPDCAAKDAAKLLREDTIRAQENAARLEREMRLHEHDLEVQICQGCENSKLEIARLHDEIRLLIDKLTEKPAVPVHTGPAAISQPRQTTMPWSVRRSMLETASREKAAALANAAKPDVVTSETVKPLSTEELEVEMGVVEKEREGKTGTDV